MPGFIGFPEIMLLALVALLLFGPKKLPEMGRGLGKGMREFKESVTGDKKDELDLTGFELGETVPAREPVAVVHEVRTDERTHAA